MKQPPPRRGFTLIEILMVIVIIGILVRTAVPKLQTMKDRATAARIVGAITVVRHAAFQYSEATAAWPPTTGRGTVPTGLATYLPRSFTFNQRDVQLAWQLVTVTTAGRTRQYGVIQAFPLTVNVCSRLYTVLGGTRNANIVSACTTTPRVDFYVDR